MTCQYIVTQKMGNVNSLKFRCHQAANGFFVINFNEVDCEDHDDKKITGLANFLLIITNITDTN